MARISHSIPTQQNATKVLSAGFYDRMQPTPSPKVYPVEAARALLQVLFALVHQLEGSHVAIGKNRALLRTRTQDLQGMLACGLSPHAESAVAIQAFIQRLKHAAEKLPEGIEEHTAPAISMSGSCTRRNHCTRMGHDIEHACNFCNKLAQPTGMLLACAAHLHRQQ